MERTFIILKPDAIERKLVGEIISRIEHNDLSIIYAKKIKINEEQAHEHYNHIKKYDFYNDMITYYTSQPVLAMIIEGDDAIAKMRSMAGSVMNPTKGNIRGDYGCCGYKNLIHTSDCPKSYGDEVARFLKDYPQCIM